MRIKAQLADSEQNNEALIKMVRTSKDKIQKLELENKEMKMQLKGFDEMKR